MATDELSFSLAKNVEQLRHKLSKTEKSINSLEQLAQRKYSSDERSVASSSHHDETTSLPPPLTMEELMEEVSSLRSSIGSSHSKDRSSFMIPHKTSYAQHRSSSGSQKDTLDSISEYTLNSTSNHTFHALRPDTSYQSIQLTSSPHKSVSNYPVSKSLNFSGSISQHSLSNLERPHSRSSYRSDKTNPMNISETGISSNKSQSRTSRSFVNEALPQQDSCFPSIGIANDTFTSQLLDESAASNLSGRITPAISPQRPISARSNATSVTLTASDNESNQLKRKILLVRSENARLRTVVSQLRDQLDRYYEMAELPASLTNNNEEQLAEKIVCLLDQVKANERTLRVNEDELEYKDKMAFENEKSICALELKVRNVQKALEESQAEKLSAETAKHEATHDVAILSHKLKEAYMSMTTRLQETQDNAQKDITKMVNERSITLKKYENMKHENESLVGKMRDLQKKLRSVEDESRQQDGDAAQMMDQAQQRIRELVVELDEKHSSLKKSTLELNFANQKKRELQQLAGELNDQNALQRERLESCQRENEASKLEMSELQKSMAAQMKRSQAEAVQQHNLLSSAQDDNLSTPVRISPRKHQSVITELNMQITSKETHIKRLEARLAGQVSESNKYESIAEELLTVSEKARSSERRANELEDVVHLMENERTKYLRKVNDLEDQVHDKSSECESLEKRLKERTTMLNQCQRQNEDLTSNIATLEGDCKRKKDELASLNKRITDQDTEEQLMKVKLSEAQAQHLQKSRTLESATERSAKQEAQARREMKKIKKLHTEQCEELGEQIEMLQTECNKYKSQSNVANQQVMMMNDQVVASSRRIQQLEGELELVRKDEKCRNDTHEKALLILEEKLATSTATIQTLEQTLSQCKNELTHYIEKLHEAHSSFKHQIAIKSDQVAKLETDWKLAQTSLQNECSRTMELESALEGRQKMLEEAASRISELEESQAALQAQVAKYEQQQSSENSKARLLLHEMEGKLEQACRELATKKQQYTELNRALKKVDEDFRECKKELTCVDAEVEELRCEREMRVQEMERCKFEWKEMKTDLDRKIERIAELEAKHQKLRREEKMQKEKLLDLETEVTQLRSQNEDARQHNDELQSYSQHRNADIFNKEMVISQLQAALKNAQTECESAKSTSKDLETSLEDRQLQLQQRAAQLTQLDMQVREFRSSVEKRNVELENELERTQMQLRERNNQVSHLDEQLTLMRSDVAEVRRLLAEEERNVKRHQREAMQNEGRVEELTKTVEAERKSREERHQACIETSQEMRVTREREQKSVRDFQDCQRELSRYRREQQQLLVDIRDMGETMRGKDERLDKLSSQLASITSEKISVETKYRDELDKTQNDAFKLKQQYEDENEDLAAANSQLRTQLRVASGNQTEELTSALEREREARNETKRTKDAMLVLERELIARKQVIDAGNDTIMLKEAEVARLVAKLSGMERVSIMASLPNSPVKLPVAYGKENQPMPVPAGIPNTQAPLHGRDVMQGPVWTMDDITSTSLFTGTDSEIGSLAPSFVPIAASTKRQPVPPLREDSSFFLTSSPNHDPQHLTGISTDEESLCKRVFGESVQLSNYDNSSSDSLTHVAIGKRRKNPPGQLRPERCMADLQEKLRASEQRRKEVASKLRHLKGAVR